MVVADLGVVGDDREVGPHHHLEAARDGVAVDDGDGRLRDQPVVAEREKAGLADDLPALGLVAEGVGVELLEVPAGAEGAAAATDDDRPDLVVVGRHL